MHHREEFDIWRGNIIHFDERKKMRKGFNLSSFVLNILMIRQYNFAQNF